ncbi:MAG: hypothetical protein ABW221_10500 [Vicinamibacteria bacterium]
MPPRSLAVALFLLAPAVQAAEDAPNAGGQTVTVVPGARYGASAFHRFFLGSGYRRLWTTPIRVPVLDLATFSGGLKVDEKGGGKQTKALKFDAADGREWKFRSLDKDPTPVLPKALQTGIANDIVQDQISASHPGNSLVVDALARAAGIPVVPRLLVVLPDDARLGEFRKEFAGLLGTLEQDPSTKDPVTPGFERFSDLEETVELWERMEKDPAEQVDAEALVYARLFDLVIGDYDRHKDQWDFGKDRTTGRWVPVPKDRDLAFVNFDGLVLAAVRPGAPRLVKFESEFPSIFGLTWQARFVDRRFLSGVSWPEWEQAARKLQAALTDPVVDDAVRQMPPEFYAIDGPQLAARIKSRREQLRPAARRFYELLAGEVELHATDRADTLEAVRQPDGSLDVVASSQNGPYFRRHFDPKETDEVRVYLKGGDDRAVTHGAAASDIKLRVVGGAGNDVLDDSDGGHSRFYDDAGENRIVRGPDTRVSGRSYEHPKDRAENPLRDWGGATGIVPWGTVGGGLGAVVGFELRHTSYGFRKHPFASRHSLTVGYSTALRDFGAEYGYEALRTDNRGRFGIEAKISKLELIRFHGFGNDTAITDDDDFYEVKQRQYSFAPSYRLELDALDVHVGPVVKFAKTDLDDRSTLLGLERPYGTEDFGQVGARVRVALDRRDIEKAPTRGGLVLAEASVYPATWSVRETFGEVHGEAATYLTAPIALRPTLALRAGAQKVFGEYPFHESAFLGGTDTIRGLRRQRYAGDASVYGNAELRLALVDRGETFLSRLGVFGLLDGGRVFLRGEESDRWHTGVGGGLWLAIFKPGNVVSLAVARSEGRTRIYAHGGFMF